MNSVWSTMQVCGTRLPVRLTNESCAVTVVGKGVLPSDDFTQSYESI
ncbi:MAG: hypothetical protein WAK84_02560 [Candidatus Cybelea sp.]